MLRKILILYLGLLAVYMLIVIVSFNIRYKKAENGAELYTVRLKKFYRKYLRRKGENG